MDTITISMVNTQDKTNFSRTKETLTLNYPCTSNSLCSAYSFFLPKGVYLVEAYGASAGSHTGKVSTLLKPNSLQCESQEIVERYKGNTLCYTNTGGNHPGAGGYIGGVLRLPSRTQIYVNIGGAGEFSTKKAPKGGYNGGGNALFLDSGSASGGGATDMRLLQNDFYHRVIVGGGGGGTDNYEGYGGAGGYPCAQSYWIGTTYYPKPIAEQQFGFSFGQGESAGPKTLHPNSTSSNHNTDVGGAGGGWFGGFCSGHGSGGAGGGSSFIYKKGSPIPTGKIKRYTDTFQYIEEQEYPFLNEEKYKFTNCSDASGIWSGNGLLRITALSLSFEVISCNHIQRNYNVFFRSMIVILIS